MKPYVIVTYIKRKDQAKVTRTVIVFFVLLGTAGQIFYELQHIESNAAGKETCEADLSMELKKIASGKGFMISDNQGSGNCMFVALSEQLNIMKGIQISHDKLREAIVRHLMENPKLVGYYILTF